MKKEDLMIGDWVNIRTEKDDKPMYSQVEQLWKCEIDADFQTDYENVHPIPLTQEILEKNGFYNSNLVDDYIITSGVHYNVDSKQILFGFEYGTALEIKCEFVHELQHALKLCGIEKEIVL